MIAKEEDALVSDMAETYHIFDFRALPVKILATLCYGLRPDSRIKMAIAETPVTQSEILLAGIVDRLGQISWMLSADGQKGINYPASVLDMLLGNQKGEGNGAIQTFDSPEEYEAAMRAAKGGE